MRPTHNRDIIMKKILMVLCMTMCLFTINTFAQEEVRGIETRRVIYEGPKYITGYSGNNTYATQRYGWEITNRNSITASVDITLYCQVEINCGGNRQPAGVAKTQSIILKPGETYIFKREEHCSTEVKHASSNCCPHISSYYIEYKAYKLQ